VTRTDDPSLNGGALTRNTAERVHMIEAAHNQEVAGSNPAPATRKGPGHGALPLVIYSCAAPDGQVSAVR
jgi:hypothetical protein